MKRIINRKQVLLASFLVFLPTSTFAYDSTMVGWVAGEYLNTATLIDYFYRNTRCKNTDFGMLTTRQKARDFVLQDILKLLTPKDAAELRRGYTTEYISSIEERGGPPLLTIFRSKMPKGEPLACEYMSGYLSGKFTSGITGFYVLAQKK